MDGGPGASDGVQVAVAGGVEGQDAVHVGNEAAVVAVIPQEPMPPVQHVVPAPVATPQRGDQILHPPDLRYFHNPPEDSVLRQVDDHILNGLPQEGYRRLG